MSDIDEFERRLALRTTQEGLKHKAAAVDITTQVIEDALNGSLDDFQANTARPGGSDEADERRTVIVDDKIPELYPPEPKVSKKRVVNVSSGKEKQIELEILHGTDFQGPELYWKTGVKAITSNPYCLIVYHNQVCRGKTVKSSRNPIFHDKLKFHAPLDGPLGSARMSVLCDEGAGEPHTFMGEATIDFDKLVDLMALDEGGNSKISHSWIQLRGGRSGSVHISCRCLVKLK
ncbi:hypothetical protein GUITHDRAFT_154197 [Guillardia theta CCMP2712]|uniref:C2 domain-containing protein n=1 Tax=Guillardia theta (strain CCMP2712) TaxID=905079 RepID=L1IVV7_GUITC|nr:hypothetical protein GUITHDRAFT_154197 [Guillardia theta CCMP2712]EKX40237.1 hypothetical protein GUITHDRAFT_154197 [Guillardia theta CCMP2712]|eukprot:XP_005827217.1 hypothetical protein GUITHDRAFT_154197 [Guillardia theta CCMP2712]